MGITVPAEMPRKVPCKLAFVGEAPGSEEEAAGVPLVGPSGQIFNAMLRSAGIHREECLVTNVFDRKAPANDVEPWMRDGSIAIPALKRLEAELAAANPTVVVPMGGTALWAMTGEKGINDFRGAVAKATYAGEGRKILPTFHPAFIMRQWKFYVVGIGDFQKALREAEKGPDIVWPHKELYIEPTLEEVRDWCKLCRLNRQTPVSADIETGWGQITAIGLAPDAIHGMCIPFVDLRQADKSYWRTAREEAAAWREVKAVLEDPEVPKLGQNFCGYDAYWILEKMGIKVFNFSEDTRLLHHALYPELPKDLGFMGASYTEQGAWKHLGYRGRDKRDH
jgi:uracil-DNA glycosylase family 4